MVGCSSCCVSAVGRGGWGRRGGNDTRGVPTHDAVHERLFGLSRCRQCTCQAPLHVDSEDDSNCTFTPAVNHTHEALLARWAEGVTVFERLYGNALFLQRRRQQLQETKAFARRHRVRPASATGSWYSAAVSQSESAEYKATRGVAAKVLVKGGTKAMSPLCFQENDQRGPSTSATMRTRRRPCLT
ncbi:uncharacterized protein Tco025E_06462 [Trypanosoma conorhini]|uniref:Uncharacterized protein n=1 Tax=Trypanosoma conorhini TaxID=83891 RepID=A0A422P3X0_9TRYP|nr:uncharacterized protein Tco025E_06462 [Trypanosoma conorhini]RNF12408.1 hypothetical protein Tco025E_06462 [Trypanosoma conorhini]